MTTNHLSIPVLQVRHDSAICYSYWTGPRKAPTDFSQYLASARSSAYSGRVSSQAEKNMRRAIDLMLQATPSRIVWNSVSYSYHPFRIGFWTLTVSDRQLHPHSEVVKKCLSPFLDWLRYRKVLYLWKAELQERGQVHYHLTCNQFVPWTEAAKQWNNLQRKAGYLNEYFKEHKHYKPNSIDIHAVYNLRDIEAYLVKYMTKNDKASRILKGKVWGCSKPLMQKRFTTEICSTIESNIITKPRKNTDYCSIIFVPGKSLLPRQTAINYQSFIQTITK